MVLRLKRDFTNPQKKRQENSLSNQIEHNGITPYMNQFLSHGEVTGSSKDTIRRRKSALTKFIAWCEERDIQQPQEVTKPILERYQRYLYYYRKSNGEPLTFSSQHVMLSPLKTFFKWLTRGNFILYNPASELELPKKAKKLPRYIMSIDEVESVINIPNVNEPLGIRDRAILEVLYSTGMRRAELCNLSIYDVDTKRESVWVREGKGGYDRLIPLGVRALKWVEKYRTDIRPLLLTRGSLNNLFLTDYGEPYRRDFLSGIVKKFMRHAGLDVVGSCHLFRHACATHMLTNGADIRIIQAILGHRDLSTTEIYTHVSIEQLKEVHRATHPAKGSSADAQIDELLDWVGDDEDD